RAALWDGSIACGLTSGLVEVWDVRSKDSVRPAAPIQLAGHTNNVYSTAVSETGRFVSGSADSTVKVWDPAAAACVATLSGHTGAVWGVAASGLVVASGG